MYVIKISFWGSLEFIRQNEEVNYKPTRMIIYIARSKKGRKKKPLWEAVMNQWKILLNHEEFFQVFYYLSSFISYALYRHEKAKSINYGKSDKNCEQYLEMWKLNSNA